MRVDSTSTAGYQMAIQQTMPESHPENLDDATELLAVNDEGEAYSVELSLNVEYDPNVVIKRTPIIMPGSRESTITGETTDSYNSYIDNNPAPSSMSYFEKQAFYDQREKDWVNHIRENDFRMYVDYVNKKRDLIEKGVPERASLPANLTMEDVDYYNSFFFGVIDYGKDRGGRVEYTQGILPKDLPSYVVIPEEYWEDQVSYYNYN